MSKKNIRPNSGKQLYLNQIFSRGMLYTSSEMQEGFAKIIDNYDIAPTGDAASPRLPLRTSSNYIPNDDEFIYHVPFKQVNKCTYIAFNNTITEDQFINDTYIRSSNSNIRIYTRFGFNSFEERIPFYGNNTAEAENQDTTPADVAALNELKQNYKNYLENTHIVRVTGDNPKIQIAVPYYTGTDINIVQYTDSPVVKTISDTTGYIPIDIASIFPLTLTTIDGDTFHINNDKYRIADIDAPELGTKWSEVSKTILNRLLTHSLQTNPAHMFYLKPTNEYSYDRTVVKVYIPINTNFDKYVDVGALLVRIGLAVIRYTDTIEEGYIQASQDAIDDHLKIYSDIDFDPYYTPVYTDYTFGSNNLKLTNNQYIEVVKIQDENSISAKTTTTTKFVNCVYIDYLDAVGFIGRIIDPDQNNAIIYKGLILIRAYITDEDKQIFTILLPRNQGDGYYPDLITASSTGEYNLLNSNVINIANDTTENKYLNILSIIPLRTDQNQNIIDPYEIVSTTTTGSEILLKAQITENPSYTSSNILTTTDNFGFETKVDLQIRIAPHDNDGNVDITANNEDTINVDLNATRFINEYSNDTIINFNITNILSNYLTKLNSTERTIIKKYLKERYGHNDYEDITWEDIITQDDLIFPRLSNIITLTRQNDDSITITLTRNPLLAIPDKSNAELLFADSLLEIVMYREIPTDNLKNLYIHFVNNFSNINMTYSSANQLLVARTNTNISMKFYQRWYVADANSNNFELLDNEKLIFTKNTSTSTLSKVGTWSNTLIIKPTDLFYTINRTGNIIFKYSIQPRFSNKLGNNCLDALDIELENTYQEIYRISNTINLTTENIYISNNSITKNMDIKNATRINIFNKQIALYGPGTTSNVIFFSKFEQYDYYPFPSNTIEIDEPIVWIYNYKDALIIFGKYNIYMLSGDASVTNCKLNKIYENLSIKLSDVELIGTSGNNLIFFNNGEGYIILPNTYVDSASNIRIYKLTERISNFFYNPEEYIRLKLADQLNINTNLTFVMNLKLYIQNNDIYIIDNIKVNNTYNIVTWFIYNQDYKYWRMYSTNLFNNISTNYIYEAPYGNQFIVKHDDHNYLAYFLNTQMKESYYDMFGSDIQNSKIIQTILNTGYLSVDTMNDKRFKDIIIELDNIVRNSKLDIDCEFFIDGAPMVISDTDILITNKTSGETEVETDKILTGTISSELISLDETKDPTKTYSRRYGKAFVLNSDTYNINGRTHVRIPVFGKGRLPLFTIMISSDKYYEFINYALIYKEKNINRRN